MGLKDIRKKIEEKKKKMQEMIQKGKERTMQQKAERARKKINKYQNMKPGARRAIVEGRMMKKGPLAVMKEEYYRRKYEREKKCDSESSGSGEED